MRNLTVNEFKKCFEFREREDIVGFKYIDIFVPIVDPIYDKDLKDLEDKIFWMLRRKIKQGGKFHLDSTVISSYVNYIKDEELMAIKVATISIHIGNKRWKAALEELGGKRINNAFRRMLFARGLKPFPCKLVKWNEIYESLPKEIDLKLGIKR